MSHLRTSGSVRDLPLEPPNVNYLKKLFPYLLIAAGVIIVSLVLLFVSPSAMTPHSRIATDAVPPATASGISPAGGGLVGGETVTVTGTGLDQVTAVDFGGSPAVITQQSAEQLIVTAPHSHTYTAGDAAVTLSSGAGDVDGLTYTYSTVSSVDRQLEYAFAHWNNYNLAQYGDFNVWGGDCINFISQTLVARGWVATPDWFNHAQVDWAPAFVHVPSFDEWLSSHPEYGAVRLTLADRDQAKIGDVVVFDWDGDGSLDHAQLISDVQVVDGETRIAMVGHNLDSDYRDLDDAVDQQGGPASLVYIWSIPEN